MKKLRNIGKVFEKLKIRHILAIKIGNIVNLPTNMSKITPELHRFSPPLVNARPKIQEEIRMSIRKKLGSAARIYTLEKDGITLGYLNSHKK